MALVVVFCAVVAAAARPGPAAAITPMEKRLVGKINDARAEQGVRKVRLLLSIQRPADRWASHLIRADAFHHGRLAAGTSENIAWGTCGWLSVRRMVQMWLDSPPHRANLLDRSARYVGPGMARGRWRGYSCVLMAVVRFR